MYDPEFPLNVHKSSYLDLFPKQNLVYLTPHCREELTTYDHDAIYIIGGIVDKVSKCFHFTKISNHYTYSAIGLQSR